MTTEKKVQKAGDLWKLSQSMQTQPEEGDSRVQLLFQMYALDVEELCRKTIKESGGKEPFITIYASKFPELTHHRLSGQERNLFEQFAKHLRTTREFKVGLIGHHDCDYITPCAAQCRGLSWPVGARITWDPAYDFAPPRQNIAVAAATWINLPLFVKDRKHEKDEEIPGYCTVFDRGVGIAYPCHSNVGRQC
jgi:hypothetical protein